MAESNASAIPQDADARELHWVEHIYRRNERQLTVRATIAGMVIGGVMCLSNLYVFFKTGWSLGVTLTACILAFGLFSLLQSVGLSRSPFTILENNAMGSVASAAGYMTGGGNMAAFGALLMVTTMRPEPLPLMLWFGAIAALGVFAAVPLKRQLINREQLAFPTGLATAATLRTLHPAHEHAEGSADAAAAASAGSDAGKRQARLLGLGAGVAGALTVLRDVHASWMPLRLPSSVALPGTLAGRPLADWTLSLKTELVLVGAGALMSFRTAWSMMLAAIGTFVFLAPALAARGDIAVVSYKAIVGWTLWPGAALLVASGLTALVLDGKAVLRAFSGLSRILRGGGAAEDDPVAAVECPDWWFPAGFLLLGPLVVWLMSSLFAIPIWAGALAVPLAVLMGFVAARVTGETDITPTKALGPLTQLFYGAITPGNLAGNIMSANVTGGVGLHAADLLTDLKSGYVLGADPRQQLKAQLFGVVAGALVVVPAFFVLFPDPQVLGSDAWPAPSCLVWAGVSKTFAGGSASLSAAQQQASAIAALLGVALALLERLAPASVRRVLPSPAGLGIAMVIPAGSAFAMFVGASVAEIVRRRRPAAVDSVVVPLSSGVIAGESIVGIGIAMLIVAGVLDKG